jgi:hypothetical protein
MVHQNNNGLYCLWELTNFRKGIYLRFIIGCIVKYRIECLRLVYTSVSQTGFRKGVSGFPRDDNASWRKSYIGGPKFACMN